MVNESYFVLFFKDFKGTLARSKEPSIFWSQKLVSKFWRDFRPRVGDFLSNNTFTQNIDGSNLLDIFWRVCGLLSIFWSKIQSSGEHLAKIWATATAASGSNIFNTMNFDQNFDGTIECGQFGVINLIKNWTSLFCFKTSTFFSYMGPLRWIYIIVHY